MRSLDDVLKAVSRSFYLTIRMLPPALRAPVGVSYLLARASDTVADSAGSPPAARLQALAQMAEALQGRCPAPDLAPFIPGVPDASERELLRRFGEIWRLLETSDAADRADIARVLDEILRGQQLDLTRFGKPDEKGVAALETEAELEAYTYSVAGCVGEFWTRLCLRRLPRYAPGIAPEELSRQGVAFGKGLQLVNILRDMPADLANGRCYLPATEIGVADPGELRAHPALARPAFDRWSARARACLDEGLRYIMALRPWRLRLACFLPWALGMETLRLMETAKPLETAARVKVPRREVYRLLAEGLAAALNNRLLLRAARRLGGSL